MADQKSIRVLIVDDFDLTRSLLQVILRSDRFDIVGEASDGQAGLDMAIKLRPDIILLDNFMPGKSGMDILPELRAKLPSAEILMVTAADEVDQVKLAMTLGANGYIVKPFNSVTVLETLNKSREKFVHASAADFIKRP